MTLAYIHETDAVTPANSAISKGASRTGLGLMALAILFLAFDATVKLIVIPEAVSATAELGWPTSTLRALGWLQLALLVLYVTPRTAILGALLWTGYLGGAVATHVRVGNPWPSHVLFPVYVALLLWGALWLRDRRVRAMLPLRR